MKMNGRFLLGAMALLCVCGAYAEDYRVASPDNSLVATVRLSGGKLSYWVEKDGNKLVNESPLGLVTTQGDFSEGLELVSQSTGTLDDTYNLPVGKKSILRNNFHQLTLTVKGTARGWNLSLLMRVYDDGFAYRYALPKKGTITQTTITADIGRVRLNHFDYCLGSFFNRPGEYYAPNYPYESNYKRLSWTDLSGEGKDSRLNAPALVYANDTYVLMSEAANVSNTSTALLKAEATEGEFSFAYAGNDKDYLEDKQQNLRVALPMKSPWKMCMVGTLPQVFESVLTENLNASSELADLSWIRPGVASWDWGGAEGGSYAPYTRLGADSLYVDLAAEMGWPYILVDAGIGLEDTRKIVGYAREKGIETLYWQTATLNDSKDFSSANMASTLDRWKEAGIRGVKIDFWEDDSRSTMDRMEQLLTECAKRQMLVNFHGCTRPSGLRRTYPHLMTQEGVMGGEQNFWNNPYMTAAHHIDLFFTRNVVGACDYTPGDMASRKGILLGKTSLAHRMALLTAFESGIVHIAEDPDNLRHFMGRDIMKRLPAAWDDTRLLEGEVKSHATIARRHCEDWWIASVSVNARTSSVPLTFLESGKTYTAYIYKDGTCRTQMAFERRTVDSQTTLNIGVLAEGGYLVQISPRGDLDIPAEEITYEAESGRNTCSQGVNAVADDATYASGGKKMGNLGMGRLLSFRNIEATQGKGRYLVTIYYTTADDRKAELRCNNVPLGTVTMYGNGSTYSCSGMGWFRQEVTLHAGQANTFVIKAPADGWAPDIDRITVTPLSAKEETAIGQVSATAPNLPASDSRCYRIDGTPVVAANAAAGIYLVPSPQGGFVKRYVKP